MPDQHDYTVAEHELTEAPTSEPELLSRCAELAGKSLRQVADELNVVVPESQTRAKGWAGQLIECCLGATATSHPEPDFQNLGIELKTIPVNQKGKAKESTFVCTTPMTVSPGSGWSDSNVKNKLDRVLWVPIEADPAILLGNRRVGNAFLWSPTRKQAQVLEQDWRELIEMVSFGEFDKISSKHGEYLQIRPKAADSASRVKITLASGEVGLTLPRGFYLRTKFTNMLLDEQGKCKS